VTKRLETALIIGAAGLVAGGTALVADTQGTPHAGEIAVITAVFLASFLMLLTAVRLWAPAGTRVLLPLVALLSSLGIVMVTRLDKDLGLLQSWWLLAGSAIAGLVLFLLRNRGVEVLRRFRYLFLVGAIGLLALPLLPAGAPLQGVTINGSRLWVRLDLGSSTLSFQPGEAAKLLVVAFLASYLAERRRSLIEMRRSIGPVRLPEPRQLLPILLAAGIAFAVLVYQRDLGASLLLFAVFVGMLFAATDQASYLLTGGMLVGGGAVLAHRLFDHVQVRVAAWLHPFDDPTGTGFQMVQSLFALGSGGVTGVGLGSGRPDLIPAAATDFVYAAVGEELGLAGSLMIVSAFALLVGSGFGISLRAGNSFRTLLAAGLTMTLAIQTVLIISGVVRVLPITGIALPFLSYGGSALLANLVLIVGLIRISHEERA
jgi:peptidoglycan glycosyltransferase